MPEIPVPEPLPNPNGENRLNAFLNAPYHGALDTATGMTNDQAQGHMLNTSNEARRYEIIKRVLKNQRQSVQMSGFTDEKMAIEMREHERQLAEYRLHPATDELSAYIVLTDQIDAAKKADEANRTEPNK